MAVNRKRQVTNQLVADTLILSGKDHTCHDIHIENTYFGLRKENGTAKGRISFPKSRVQKVREILRNKKVNTKTSYTLDEMKELVRMKIDDLYKKAIDKGLIEKSEYKKDKIEIVFNMVGTTSGQCCYDVDYHSVKLRFHPIIMAENFDKYLESTVPHEVCHHIDNIMGKGRGTHHGHGWQLAMRTLGYVPNRCHSYSTKNVTRGGQRRWEYKCSCSTYNISTVRHNRSERYGGGYYSCRKCRTHIKWTGKQV